MADVTLQAVLTRRDGVKLKLGVKTQQNLTSILAGIRSLQAEVSELLTELVEREKHDDGCDDGDEEDTEEDEEGTWNPVPEPPAKRPRPPRT